MFTRKKCLCFHNLFVQNFVRHSSRISDLLISKPGNSSITIRGWVKGLRKMKDLTFVDVNDGTTAKHLQILLPTSSKPDNLAFGASVKASGTLQTNKNGQLELAANDFQVLGQCVFTDGYPFAARKSYPADYVRQFLHFRSRTSKFGAVLRVRDTVSNAIHQYFRRLGFIHIHTPILTSNDCEGAGEVFIVRPESKALVKEMSKSDVPEDEAYFDTKVYLTVSGQLHLEAMIRGVGSAYCFGPAFRAENSRSTRHLCEFYMVEAELAFARELSQVCAVAEGLVRAAAESILAERADDAKLLAGDLAVTGVEAILNAQPFPSITRAEAISALGLGVDAPLSRDNELELVKQFGQGKPLFVLGAPATAAPFYAKLSQVPDQVESVELLAPGVGELVGGSLREDDPEVLQNRLQQSGLENLLSWYLDTRRFGNIPSGGFGLGFERLLQTLLGISNIKDTIPFPRWPHNCVA